MELVRLNQIFDYEYGSNLELNKLEQSKNGIPFVSRTEKNNGVSAKVKRINTLSPIESHTLSVALSGSVLETFYQPEKYYSGRDIGVLYPKNEMSIKEMIAYSVLIRANKFKYNYGRAANKTIKHISIPNRKEVQRISKNLQLPKIDNKTPCLKLNITIDTSNWSYVKISDIFTIKGSETTTYSKLSEKGPGEFPYVTTKATNNGVKGFFNFYTEKGKVFTVDSAVLGYCSYQNNNFSASDHVEILEPNFPINTYIAIFIVTILNKEQYRYSYGRKCSQSNLKNSKIKLPHNNDGNIDFVFMENYIKSLPYSSNLEY